MALDANTVGKVYGARFRENLYRMAVWQSIVEDHSGEFTFGNQLHIPISTFDPTINNYDKSDMTEEGADDTDSVTLAVNQQKYFNWHVDDVDASQVRPSLIEAAALASARKMAVTVNDHLRGTVRTGLSADQVATPISVGAADVTGSVYQEALEDALLDHAEKADNAYWPEGPSRVVFMNPRVKRNLVERLVDKGVVFAGSQNDDAYTNYQIGQTYGWTPIVDPGIDGTGTGANKNSMYFCIRGNGLAWAQTIQTVENLRHPKRMATMFRGLYVYGSVRTGDDRFFIQNSTIS